ncbi:polysaccharide deacetylase [Ruminococcaceae bacterium OttesenSCG-928-D13]|nr:polysaccharide deacetylase [Ruminococcaceae bacterium OttesenSCG-928-D13]
MQTIGKVRLPEGKKIAINLGFDFDAASVWMESFGKTSQVYASRGEYGAEVGVPRILDLMDKYSLKASFFVPGHTVDTHPEVCREIVDCGHEVCHHGYVHEDPTDLSFEAEEAIMVKGLEALDKIGVRPVGYRSPGFDFSPYTVKILEKHGFVYDSSLMGNDFYPYKPRYCNVNFDKGNTFDEPSALIEMPVSWYLDDFPHLEFVMTRAGMKPPSQVYEIWKGHFDYGIRNVENGLLNVAMHPQVIGRPHNIAMLETFIGYILENGGWIAPMKDICERIEF